MQHEHRSIGRCGVDLGQVGMRRSANWNSLQPPTTRTHWGAGVRRACSRSILSASASEATPSHRSSRL